MRFDNKLVEDKILSLIPDAAVELDPLNCSRPGYQIKVTASSFKGMTLLQQHRAVKNALADLLDGELLHAVTITTEIPT